MSTGARWVGRHLSLRQIARGVLYGVVAATFLPLLAAGARRVDRHVTATKEATP